MFKILAQAAAVATAGIGGIGGYEYYQNQKIDLGTLEFYPDDKHNIVAAAYPLKTTSVCMGSCTDYRMWHRGKSSLNDEQFKKYVQREIRYPLISRFCALQKLYRDTPMYKTDMVCHSIYDESNVEYDHELLGKARNIETYGK